MNSWPLFDNMFLNHCLSLIINLAWARCCMANIIFRCGISILSTDISSHFSSRSITSSIATPVPPTVWTASVCLVVWLVLSRISRAMTCTWLKSSRADSSGLLFTGRLIDLWLVLDLLKGRFVGCLIKWLIGCWIKKLTKQVTD